MSVTPRDVLIACLFIVIGWLLHMIWDSLVGWIQDAFGGAGGILWDVCAIIGVLAVCLGVGFGVQQHWFTG